MRSNTRRVGGLVSVSAVTDCDAGPDGGLRLRVETTSRGPARARTSHDAHRNGNGGAGIEGIRARVAGVGGSAPEDVGVGLCSWRLSVSVN